MQYFLEQFGVTVSAISGVLAARGRHVDLFGVIVLAVVTAFGGGTVRDLLIGDLPVFWVKHPAYLYNAVITAVVTFFLVRYRELAGTGLLVADGFALALFSIIGAQKALSFSDAPAIAAAMGVVTGVVGGMLRDILLNEIPLVFRQEIYFYATASLCGSVIFLALNAYNHDAPSNVMIAVGITLALRLASIHWKLTLPSIGGNNQPTTKDSHKSRSSESK